MSPQSRPSRGPRTAPPADARRGAGGREWRASDEVRAAARTTQALWLAVVGVLAWWPGGFSRFSLPKLLVVALACVLAAQAPARGRLPRPLVVLAALGLALLVAAALASDAPGAALLGRWPRYEGLPTLLLYLAAAWLGARLVGPGGVGRLTAPAAVTALLLGIASVADALGVGLVGSPDGGRSGSLLGNATDQGLVAAMLLAVLVWALRTRREAWLVGAAAAAAVTVALSGSRTALVLAALSLAVLLLAARGQGRLRAVTGATGLALLVAALAAPVTRERLLSSTTLHGRLLEWGDVWPMLVDHPLLGVGPSGFLDAFGAYESTEWVRWAGPYQHVDSAHSWPLQAWSAGGVGLLAVAVAVAAYVAVYGTRAARREPALVGVAVAVVGYGVALLGHFTTPGPTTLAALLVGVLLAQGPDPDGENVWTRRALGAGGAVMSLVLLAACWAEWDLAEGTQRAAAGERTSAVASFDAAAGLRPWDADAALIAAQSLAGAAGADPAAAAEAERFADAALARIPTSYQALVARGVALRAAGRPEDAVEVLDDAVRFSPHRPAALVQRSLARAATGDLAGALEDAVRARRSAPREASVRELVAALREQAAAEN